MSQRSVEIAVGKLVVDEDAWRALRSAPDAFVAALKAEGLALSAAEETALRAIDPAACQRFARSLDPRIRKMSLTPQPGAPRGRSRGQK